MRRGITLLEMLFSLALLSLVSAAAAGWVATASSAAAIAASDGSGAIEAFFRQVQDDLSCGGFPRPEGEPVVISGGEIAVERNPGGRGISWLRYSLRGDGRVVRGACDFDGRLIEPARVVCAGVRQLAGSYDPDRRGLVVRLTIERGAEYVRRLRVP